MAHARAIQAVDQPRWECPRTGCTTPPLVGRDPDQLGQRITGHRLNHDLADLASYYPPLEDLLDHTRTTSSGGSRSGSGGGLAVPINLTILEFVDDIYLDGDDQPELGVKRTLIALEQAVCRALNLTAHPRRRPADYTGVGADPRILELIAWLRSMATRLALRQETIADDLRSQLHRLNSRAEHLLYGPRFSSTWSRCPDCAAPGPSGVGTVLAGAMKAGRMAVCLNWPACQGEDGRRTCWTYDVDVDEWLRVPEPAEAELDADDSRTLLAAAHEAGR